MTKHNVFWDDCFCLSIGNVLLPHLEIMICVHKYESPLTGLVFLLGGYHQTCRFLLIKLLYIYTSHTRLYMGKVSAVLTT